MGLPSSSGYSDLEKALLALYRKMASTTMGMGTAEATRNTKEMLDEAIKESKEAGTYHLPQNLGDLVLGYAQTDDPPARRAAEAIRKGLPRKRQEGVRDEDVCWWWNLNDVERRMMLKQDDIARIALYVSEVRKGASLDEAAAEVRRFHPIYGDPDYTAHTTGDDRPLPCELKDRINTYLERRAKSDPGNHRREIEESSTFNALIRKEIRAGRL